MGKRVNVKTTKSGTVEKVTEATNVVKEKKSLGKPVTVGEVTYPSRSEAVRKMLEAGTRKSDIAKAIGASYSFVQTIAGRSGIDYSAIKEKAKEFSSAKKAEVEAQKKLDAVPKLRAKLADLENKRIDIDLRIDGINDELRAILGDEAFAEVEHQELVAIAAK